MNKYLVTYIDDFKKKHITIVTSLKDVYFIMERFEKTVFEVI